MLNLIKKLVPKKIFNFLQPSYHFLMALFGAIIYRFPSNQIKVIGITGTKGKTSTTEILSHILEKAGYKVASTSTLQFKINGKPERNLFKMSMPGRFFLQKFLRRAVKAKCDYAIIEMTSEGSKLFRHKFIALNGLIFTNISPEHIESHGSFEKYLMAKLAYAKALNSSKKTNKKIIVNGEDQESNKFIELAPTAQAIKFRLADVEPVAIKGDGLELTFNGEKINSPLSGKFNLYNIIGATTTAIAEGVDIKKIKEALEDLEKIPGRLEKVITNNPKQNFDVVVDYAHTADSLTKAYEAFGDRRKICVLGSTGGGRDQWKRPEMGKVADKFCSIIILTNDDPYDEDPQKITEEIAQGINKDYQTIIDRREAIKTALRQAKENDVVMITGKGTDPYLMEANNKKTPWNDYEITKEELEKILNER